MRPLIERPSQPVRRGHLRIVAPWPDADSGPDTASLEGAADAPTCELTIGELAIDEAASASPAAQESSLSLTQEPVKSEPTRPASAATREIGTGSVLRGRYVLGNSLGAGGTSTVFQAQDRLRAPEFFEGGVLAIKVLRPELRTDAAVVRRMTREFRHMQRLMHANIARVYDLDCDDGAWFMTMELLQGQTVRRWLNEGAGVHDPMQIVLGCCDALMHAHELGVMHGDLKPGNVFVSANGSVKLFDFGSAPSRSETAVDCGAALTMAATPSYASPQILKGNVAELRDDVFSLACLAYEILGRGKHPFERKSSLEARDANLRPAYVPSITPRIFDVICRGLSWERAQRPSDAREFLHALLACDLSKETGKTRAHAPARAASAMVAAAPAAADAKPVPAEVEATETRSRATRSFARPFTSFNSNLFRTLIERGHALQLGPSRRKLLAGLAGLAAVAILAASYEPQQVAAVSAPSLEPEIAAIVLPPAAIVRREFVEPAATFVAQLIPASPAPRPAAAGSISFKSSAVHVSAQQSLAVITLERLESTAGRASVVFSTVGESAQPGVDYESVDSQVVRFNEGQRVRSLFIPLLSKGKADELLRPRTFNVRLEAAPGSPTLGPIKQVKVTILPTDPPPLERLAGAS
jgi:serine/threonine protein kinase